MITRKNRNQQTDLKLNKFNPKASANSGRIWRILRNVFFTVLLIIFMVQIVLTILLKVKSETAATKIPVRLLEITSDSMYPKIHTGDGVVETSADFTKLKTGDIITFYQSGDLVTHEIIEVNDDGTVTTQGKANAIPDQPVIEEMYAGKVQFILPGLSGFLSLSYGPVRKAIWIALFVVILFGPDIVSKLYDVIAERTKKQDKPTES